MNRREMTSRYWGFKSDAWHEDGGANDEGWHDKYCYNCGKTTEHGRQVGGSYCVPCDNRKRVFRSKVKTHNVEGYVVKEYPNGAKYCNCKGFKFRKTCRHIGQV